MNFSSQLETWAYSPDFPLGPPMQSTYGSINSIHHQVSNDCFLDSSVIADGSAYSLLGQPKIEYADHVLQTAPNFNDPMSFSHSESSNTAVIGQGLTDFCAKQCSTYGLANCANRDVVDITPDINPQEPIEAENARKKFICQEEGCSSRFKRRSDLERHQKKHQPPIYHCLERGCRYHHAHGFYRRDKLTSHQTTKHGLGLKDHVYWGFSQPKAMNNGITQVPVSLDKLGWTDSYMIKRCIEDIKKACIRRAELPGPDHQLELLVQRGDGTEEWTGWLEPYYDLY